MNNRANFEDNIYILLVRIRMIRDILTLDTDPELFFDKTIDDIEFIDRTLNTLLLALLENHRLIERNELFSHLSELEWQFEQVLSEVLSGSGSISAGEFPVVRDKLTVLRMNSLERRKNADTTGAAAGNKSEEPLVSSDELNELLKAF
jgi:hypothetical protein